MFDGLDMFLVFVGFLKKHQVCFVDFVLIYSISSVVAVDF